VLKALEIRNIVLIEALDLEFEPGLNVLTGETGAGKSILLDALGFALGRKGRRDLVRSGAGQGSVTAVFALGAGHPALKAAEALGLGGEAAAAGELVLRRVQNAGGPARGFVNDQRAGSEALAEIGALLVEVHGQRDDLGLLDRRGHRSLLDAYAGTEAELAAVRAAWRAREAVEARLGEARERLAAAAADADYLRHSLAELERLAPEPGEDEALDTERRLIQAAARIGEEVIRAGEALSGQGAEGMMADALARLTGVADRAEGQLDPAIAALDRAMVELGEAQAGVEAALEALSFDPGRLEQVEERLFALRALARKHQTMPDALAELAADMARRLDEIDQGDDHIAALEAEVQAAQEAYAEAAAALTARRTAAGARLDAAVTEELGPLRMEGARFLTGIAPGTPGPEGVDDVGFTAAINPGMPAGPIDRIASGGELSRFLLALKVCLAARSEGLTMIFDEIDRGVGGATAAAVGRRLARLAAEAQVLVVTHSPQVAAEGQHHWRIAKTSSGEITRTDVRALAPGQRVDEIARMLAGDEITTEARSAARALMEQAG